MFLVPSLDLPLWTIGFASFGPALSAFLVRGPLLGEGFAQSGLGLVPPPGRRWTYALVLVGPPVVVAVSVALLVAVGAAGYLPGQWHDPYVGQDFIFQQAAQNGPGALIAVAVVSTVVPLLAFGEEFGWRGYLFPRLMPLGLPAAVVLSGAIWAVWHLPGYFIYGPGIVPGFVLFGLSTIASGGFLCWLRLRARSVWPAAIWHAAYDTQAPAVAGLLMPLHVSVAQLTTDLMGGVLIAQMLATAFLLIGGGLLRAAREDMAVWNPSQAR
jgi:CAAX protease family protein